MKICIVTSSAVSRCKPCCVSVVQHRSRHTAVRSLPSGPESLDADGQDKSSHLTRGGIPHPPIHTEHNAAQDNQGIDSPESASPSPETPSMSVEVDDQRTAWSKLQMLIQQRRSLERYHDLLQQEKPDLFSCAMLISQHAYVNIDKQWCRNQVQDIVDRVNHELPAESRYPLRIIKAINKVMFADLKFAGNTADYYNRDNSCVNRVLENRAGIPITLSLIYMEVSKAVGLPMTAVNLPGHLMIRPDNPDVEFLVDVFNGGEVCTLTDAEGVLSQVLGANIVLDPKWAKGGPPMSARSFLMRMLSNLMAVYQATLEFDEMLWIVRFMRATEPTRPHLAENEGVCLVALGRAQEALAMLSEYIEGNPNAEDFDRVKTMVQRLKPYIAEGGGSESIM